MNYSYFVNEIINQSQSYDVFVFFKTRSNMSKLPNIKTKDFGI